MESRVAELTIRVILCVFVAEVVLGGIAEVTGSFHHRTDAWVIGLVTSALGAVVASSFKKAKK